MNDSGWDFADWPSVAPTEILTGLWMGGLSEDEYIGDPVSEAHYAFAYPFEIVLTLYADAQPVPWGVTELRYGFPDDVMEDAWALRCVELSSYAFAKWQTGSRVLIRCQQGVNRSGFVTALVLMRNGYSAPDAVAVVRGRRGAAVLNNDSFERWLLDRAGDYIR